MARNGLVEPFWRVGDWDFEIGWRAILIGLHWVTLGGIGILGLGGIGIARAHYRSHAHFYCETTPPSPSIIG